ncbi:hypothetical protein DEO72_LG9g413 [Vigna unguiculata]|uniref:Thrombospondin-related anonymous protein n=1 Tax=Vigna unguiculata TaxID=3917 RepID=A0A4D6MVA2_VIGUN|nr:hypothetical protein DEO72_LG9g413 [Vigna unguiculata]
MQDDADRLDYPDMPNSDGPDDPNVPDDSDGNNDPDGRFQTVRPDDPYGPNDQDGHEDPDEPGDSYMPDYLNGLDNPVGPDDLKELVRSSGPSELSGPSRSSSLSRSRVRLGRFDDLDKHDQLDGPYGQIMLVKFVNPARPSPSKSLAQLGPTGSSIAPDPSGLSGLFVSLDTPDKFVVEPTGIARVVGPSVLSRLSGCSRLSVNELVGPLGLSDMSPVLLGPSDSLTCLSCQTRPIRLLSGHPVRLGHRACSTRLCCQVGLIRLECLASLTWLSDLSGPFGVE